MVAIYLVDINGNRLVDINGVVLADQRSVLGNAEGAQPFLVADIEMSRPATGSVVPAYGHATSAHGTFSLLAYPQEDTATLTVSDVGYRTDGEDVVAYPPTVEQAFRLDARLPIGPGQTGVTWAWGALALINPDRAYDALLQGWNFDGRAVTIRYGQKRWDDRRGLWVDPPQADLVTLFTGMAKQPVLDERSLQIPLRDASYWLERKLQRNLFAGTGEEQGTADMAGTPMPKLRGVRYNITLTLIDEATNTYAVSDGPATFQAVYEAAGETIDFQADTTDLWSGLTDEGYYRTDVSRGLIQFGLKPTSTPTVDATGAFPGAGEITTVAAIARYLLAEDMQLPAAYLNAASFTAADATYPYEAGFYWAPGDQVDGVAAIAEVLSSFGATLAPAIDGTLKIIALRAPSLGAPVAASYDESVIISCEPRALPDAIAVPCYRIPVGYARNETVQRDQFSGSATEAHLKFVQSELRYATFYDGAVALAYRNANDHPAIGGGLTTEADAQAVANGLGGLFGQQLWQFDVTIPLAIGLDDEVDFGDDIGLTYPNHAMANGAVGIVTGRSVNIEDLTMILTVTV